MKPSHAITAQVSADTNAMIERLAKARGVSKAGFVAEAVQRVAESESDFLAFVQVGIDAADRGDVVPHHEVMTELEAMIEKHRARCRK